MAVIAFYARVSSDEQRERQTIQTQLEYARSRAALEGWTLREFTDDGISGTVPLAQRPGGRALLAAARAGEFDVVATYRLDRLGRTQRVVLEAIDVLKAAGARYRSLTEPFEVGTPFGDAALGMTSVFAQLERDSIAQRTKEGRRRVAHEAGRNVGHPAPFGYRNEGKHVVVDDAAAVIVREIYRLYLEDGTSVDGIADELNARGIPAAKGGRWHGSLVSHVLRSPTYRGEARFAGISRDVPAIVTAAQWSAARDRASSNYRWKRAHLRRSYALRGLLRCECGLALTAFTYFTKRDHSAFRKAYRCSWDHRLSTRAPVVKEDEALAVLWADVERFFADPNALVRRLVAGVEDDRDVDQELLELAAKIRDVDAREARLLSAHTATLFRPEAIAAQAAELTQERQGIEARMRRVRSSRNDRALRRGETAALRARLLELRRRVRTADEDTKAAVLRELVRSTRVEFVALHRARLTVSWIFDAQEASVGDVHVASTTGTWLQTVHELGRAA